MRLFLKISFIFLFISGFSYAQNDSLVNIKGIAKDSTSGLPVQGALVKLQEVNNELLKYSETGADGSFSFASVPPGSYEVQLVKEPYTPVSTYITVQSSDIDLGNLFMSHNYTTEEIVVETKKPFMEIRDDKKIFNVGDNPITEGKTAIELLQTLPLVSVDADDNVMLRGDRRIKILINGKENRMYSSLRQVPANMIEKVELITTPSAKYEAEGVSGVINIILKRSYSGGYSGFLSLGTTTHKKYNGYGSLNIKLSKFSLFSRLGGGSYGGDVSNESYNENFLFNPSIITSSSTGKNSGNYLFGSLGAEYELSKRSVLGFDGSLNGYKGDNNLETIQNYYSKDSNSASLYYGNSNYDGLRFNTSLYFNTKFDSTDHELNIDASYSRNNNDNTYDQERLTYTPFRNIEDRKMLSNTFTGQIDYINPFGNAIRLEAGYKGTFDYNSSELNVDSLNYSSGIYVPDIDRSQDFDFDYIINGFYTTLSKNFSPFTLKLGGRVEITKMSIGDANKSTSDYTDIFPSASLTFKFGMAHSIQLSYARKISRPNSWQLNPFVRISNNQTISTGNPELSPEYTNVYELNFNFFAGDVYLSPGFYYKGTSNVINSYSYITDTNTTVFTYDNSAELDNYGADLVFGGKLFDLIDFNSSLSISHLSFTGAPGRNMNNEGTSYGGNANLTIPFGDIFSLGVNYFRWGDGVTAQGTREGKNYLSFSISKMFLDKKLRLNFAANDVLANVGKPESFTNGIGYKSTYSNNYSQQSFSINISYNFGNTEETSRQRRKKKTEPPQTQPPDSDLR